LLKPDSAARNVRLSVDGPPRTPLDKVADVLAALKAGKLPSQDQLHILVKEFLASDALKASNVAGGALDADLAAESEKLVFNLREACVAVLQLGMEKNDDDKFQDLVYHMRRLSSDAVKVEAPDFSVQTSTGSTQKELGKVGQHNL